MSQTLVIQRIDNKHDSNAPLPNKCLYNVHLPRLLFTYMPLGKVLTTWYVLTAILDVLFRGKLDAQLFGLVTFNQVILKLRARQLGNAHPKCYSYIRTVLQVRLSSETCMNLVLKDENKSCALLLYNRLPKAKPKPRWQPSPRESRWSVIKEQSLESFKSAIRKHLQYR